MGSNGLTSARHDVFNKSVAEEYPETFDPGIPYELVFSGKKALTDKVNIPGFGQIDAAKLVLSPHTYIRPRYKAEILSKYRSRIDGIVHCSGGAQTKVLHFIDSLHADQGSAVPCTAIVPFDTGAIRYQLGRKCIRCSIWATVWSCAYRKVLLRILLRSRKVYNIDAHR